MSRRAGRVEATSIRLVMRSAAAVLALVGLGGTAARPQEPEGERIGDWVLTVRTEPFNDVQVTTASLAPGGADAQGAIASVEIRCRQGLWDESLWLAVPAPGAPGEGEGGGLSLAYRLGEAGEREEAGDAAPSDGAPAARLEATELAALKADPHLSVTLTDADTGESWRAGWTDLAGTDEMLRRLPCAGAGGAG